MITNLKPYPAYKDSGVEWLGQVPEHWEVRRLGSLLQERRETNEGLRVTEVLSVLRKRGVIPYAEKGNIGNKKSDDISRYKVVRPNDIVVNSMNVIIGSVGLSKFTGCISPVYYILTRRDAQDDPGYLNAYFQTKPFQQSLIRLGNGILAHRMRIPMELLKCEPFPRPPADEQTAIVRFLDYMDRRIRRVIRARQQRIKLLEEYKQALIHQAVTGQIDVRTGQPYPAYKPSGVEWLGQVPEHWVVRRLKRIARLNPSKSEVPLAMRNDPAVFLPMERVGSDGRFDASEVRPISALWNGFTYFRRGDVIVAKITPCFENGKGACLENLPTALGFGSTEFHVIRPSNAIVSAYLYRVTTLSEFRRLGADEMTGAAGQQRVPVEFIANFPIPIPPLPEQTAIVEYLDAQTAKIDAAIAADRRSIELMQEFRTRLIADVVTGKLDVHEVAAKLPDEPPEEEEEVMEDEGTGEEGEAPADAEQGAVTEEAEQ